MSSPRKFAEKIALIQQKQAEGDAAFNTIIYEVEAAKRKVDRTPSSSTNNKLNVPTKNYKLPNGMNNKSDNQTNQNENNNDFDHLLLPPDNTSCRRTHSESSLHRGNVPTVVENYHAQLNNNENNNQQLNSSLSNCNYQQHLQVANSQYPYDLNNNNNCYYSNNQDNLYYPSTSSQTVLSPTTDSMSSRYNNGTNNSNVLMVPPNQYSRNGGSLPDLRVENIYNNQQLSFAPVASTSINQNCYRSSLPDGYFVESQQRLSSNIGPLKKSSSMRRRHSPIGDVKQLSPRRQTSPSPDATPIHQNVYCVEPQSPQSQSSYSSQNSPNLLPSPNTDYISFSPKQQQQQSSDNQLSYFTLPNHFDQITLDNNNYYSHQRSISPSSQQTLSTTVTNDQHQRNYYPPFIDDMSFASNQITREITKPCSAIPDIILTDVDSSKLDLSKELTSDFSTLLDNLIDANDFLLNEVDLSLDPIICDDAFPLER